MTAHKITLETDNIFKLILLHRVLHKSKFQKDLHDLYSLFGSQWSNCVLDKIIEYYHQVNDTDQLEVWTNWRILTKQRLEYPVILEKLKEIKEYVQENNSSFPLEEKLENIQMITSPFVLSEDLLEDLLKELA